MAAITLAEMLSSRAFAFPIYFFAIAMTSVILLGRGAYDVLTGIAEAAGIDVGRDREWIRGFAASQSRTSTRLWAA